MYGREVEAECGVEPLRLNAYAGCLHHDARSHQPADEVLSLLGLCNTSTRLHCIFLPSRPNGTHYGQYVYDCRSYQDYHSAVTSMTPVSISRLRGLMPHCPHSFTMKDSFRMAGEYSYSGSRPP